MREMKLSISGISHCGERVKAYADVAFKSCVLGMDMSTPYCRLDVSVPYKEGKPLEQYETELTAKAKEHITEMYKEIVCGGEMDSEIVIGIQGKCTSGYNVKVISKNGKLQLSNDHLQVNESSEPRESGETSSMWSVKLDDKGRITFGDDGGMFLFNPTKPFINDVTINDDSLYPLLQELAGRMDKLEKSMGNGMDQVSLKEIYTLGRKAAEEFFKREKSNGGCL